MHVVAHPNGVAAPSGEAGVLAAPALAARLLALLRRALMKEFRKRPTRCPGCGAEINAATNVTGTGRVSKGDVSLCLKCGEWLIYTNTYQLRLPSSDELATLRADPRCQKVRLAWQTMMKNQVAGN
jgi:hypothetical protein